MASKARFTAKGQDIAASFLNLADSALSWRDTYWDRTYNTGGADELTDQDVAAAGVTAADITGMTTFADALESFLVANRPYLSKMRNDL